jgi:glucans biosynthesis protein C
MKKKDGAVNVTTEKNPSSDRVVFFDNLRLFFVGCVVLQHAANGYLGLDWWPVSESEVSIVVNGLAAIFDAFTMPLLFYIAGYFAIPVIERKGVKLFLFRKLKRLGVPWIVVSLTICPILPLVYHYTRNGFSLKMGYWEMTLELFRNAAKLDVGIIPSMNDLMATNRFYQRYMWFLSLLILFFVIFAALYGLRKRWFQRVDESVRPASRSALSTLGFMLSVALLTSLLSFGVIGLMFALNPGLTNPEPLFTLGNIIQFRPSRLPLFVIYFALGILTYRNRWIARDRFPGHLKTWLICFIVFLLPYLVAHYQVRFGPKDLRELYGAVFFLLSNILAIASLGLFTSIAMRYWHRPTPINRMLAANSYYLYLSHYPYVIAFQLLLIGLGSVPGLIKFIIVSALSSVSAVVTSQFLIRPHPKLSIVMAIGLFVLMALVLRV